MHTNDNLYREYAELVRRKRELQEQLRELQYDISAIELRVIDKLAQEGIDSVRIADIGTIYTTTQLQVAVNSMSSADIVGELISRGRTDLLMYSPGRVKSCYQEDETKFEQELSDLFRVNKVITLCMRRA